VWALGISAVEMAEGAPPRWAVHPMRVIFMISREPPPQLADRDRWSLPFHDFVAQCLHKARPPQRDPNPNPILHAVRLLVQARVVCREGRGQVACVPACRLPRLLSAAPAHCKQGQSLQRPDLSSSASAVPALRTAAPRPAQAAPPPGRAGGGAEQGPSRTRRTRACARPRASCSSTSSRAAAAAARRPRCCRWCAARATCSPRWRPTPTWPTCPRSARPCGGSNLAATPVCRFRRHTGTVLRCLPTYLTFL
jgi:hypothetical protein